MPDILIPAFITAAATLMAGSISSLVTWKMAKRRERERRSEHEAATTASFKAITDALARFYGMKARRITNSMEILDHTGLGRFTKTIDGIRTMSDAVIRSIPIPMEALSSAQCVREPELSHIEFSRPGSIQKTGGTGSYIEYALEVTGGLTRADVPLSFSVESKWRDTFFMTREAAAAGYKEAIFKHEYFAASIIFPVEEGLEVRVSFPKGYPVICYPAVFPKASEEFHLGELERTRAGFESSPGGARFFVREPLIGFQYAIYWEPPPASSLGSFDSTI